MNLTDVHARLVAADKPLMDKTASLRKQAEEEDAAGRIMARGFADELRKLAEDDSSGVDGDANYTAGGPMYGHGGGVHDKAKGGGYAPGKGLPPKTPPSAKRKPKDKHEKAPANLED